MMIFDGIEKLINEHGSAKTLGERLLLARDQHAAQERRISELMLQLKISEDEKATLRSQLRRSQAENENLTQLIETTLKQQATELAEVRGLAKEAIERAKAVNTARELFEDKYEHIAKEVREQKERENG